MGKLSPLASSIFVEYSCLTSQRVESAAFTGSEGNVTVRCLLPTSYFRMLGKVVLGPGPHVF